MAARCPTRSACRRAPSSCRSCRCSTSTPGACPTPAPLVGAKLVFPGVGARRREPATSCSRRSASPSPPACRPCGSALLNHMQANKLKLSTLKYAVIGGSAAPPAMIETLRQGVRRRGAACLGHERDEPARHGQPSQGEARSSCRPTSCSTLRLKQGRPPFGVDMKIVDDAGKELPRDGKAFGDLLVRGPWITSGYFKGEGGEVLQRGRLVRDRRRRHHRSRRLHADHRPLQGRDQVGRRMDQLDRPRERRHGPSRRRRGRGDRRRPSRSGTSVRC